MTKARHGVSGKVYFAVDLPPLGSSRLVPSKIDVTSLCSSL